MVPKIAKRIKKRPETTITLKMSGIALISDYTAILKPGFLDIILNGLKTLSILRTLNISNLTFAMLIEMMEKVTIKKSI